MAQGFTPQPLPVDDADVVGDVNRHTHGTEFYGTSSNFVLLNRFFAYARQHLPPGQGNSSNRDGTSYLSLAGGGGIDPSFCQDRTSPRTSISGSGLADGSVLSIVNLLSNDEALESRSRPNVPPHVRSNGREVLGNSPVTLRRDRNDGNASLTRHDTSTTTYPNSPSGEDASIPYPSAHISTKEAPTLESSLQTAKRRLEREYVRLFMSNLHHLHPMLDPIAFVTQCEEEVWNVREQLEMKEDARHFFALYNIVVAVGAINAGASIAQSFKREADLCMKQSTTQSPNSSLSLFSQELSKGYFHKAKSLLGNFFEVCSLESAQTLLLMVGHPPPIVSLVTLR